MMTDTIDTTATGPADRVRELLDDVLTGSAVFPVDVVVRGRGASMVVDVFVDSGDAIGADDLAGISRRLGRLLDETDVIGGAYRLNVSTPGADRPLRDARQFAKHAGRRLALLVAPGPGEEAATLEGTLVSVERDTVTLRDEDGSERRIPIATITEARVQLPW